MAARIARLQSCARAARPIREFDSFPTSAISVTAKRLLTGFGTLTKPWVFVTDSDLQFDLSELALLLPYRQTASFIQGYRKQRRDPWMRIQLGRIYRTGINLLFGLPVRDPECSFRLIRTDLIRGITLDSRGAFVCSELIYKAKCRGAIIVEVGVSHCERQRGASNALRLSVLLRLIKDVTSLFVNDRVLGAIRRGGKARTATVDPQLAGGKAGTHGSSPGQTVAERDDRCQPEHVHVPCEQPVSARI